MLKLKIKENNDNTLYDLYTYIMWALIHEFLILVFYHSANFLMQAL